MKTTMDIDDELLLATKEAAVRRRTTMKAIVEHALRREITPSSNFAMQEPATCYTMGKHGLPILKRKSKTKLSSKTIYQMMEDEGI